MKDAARSVGLVAYSNHHLGRHPANETTAYHAMGELTLCAAVVNLAGVVPLS